LAVCPGLCLRRWSLCLLAGACGGSGFCVCVCLPRLWGGVACHAQARLVRVRVRVCVCVGAPCAVHLHPRHHHARFAPGSCLTCCACQLSEWECTVHDMCMRRKNDAGRQRCPISISISISISIFNCFCANQCGARDRPSWRMPHGGLQERKAGIRHGCMPAFAGCVPVALRRRPLLVSPLWMLCELGKSRHDLGTLWMFGTATLPGRWRCFIDHVGAVMT
jgi:hypothetical protein